MAQFLEETYEVFNSMTDGGDGSTARVLAYKKTQEIFSKGTLTPAGGIGFEELCWLYMHMTSDGLLSTAATAIDDVPVKEIRHL